MEIIDTYPDFQLYWKKAENLPVKQQMDLWQNIYMEKYPELLHKQLDDWEEQEEDWKQVAAEKIFPFLPGRFEAMHVAHKNLLKYGPEIYASAQDKLCFQSEITFVIFVGICGAGWVTLYRGSPAILFGLEGITEYGWGTKKPLSGLVAHEIGHVAHQYWRKLYGKVKESGPWWHIYEEGFAQYCEGLIIGNSFHQTRNDKNWLKWCREHETWLASQFLLTVKQDKPVTPFFGSWFNIEGRIETGYFLGHQLIQELAKKMSLKEIALLDNIEQYVKPVIQRISEKHG